MASTAAEHVEGSTGTKRSRPVLWGGRRLPQRRQHRRRVPPGLPRSRPGEGYSGRGRTEGRKPTTAAMPVGACPGGGRDGDGPDPGDHPGSAIRRRRRARIRDSEKASSLCSDRDRLPIPVAEGAARTGLGQAPGSIGQIQSHNGNNDFSNECLQR